MRDANRMTIDGFDRPIELVASLTVGDGEIVVDFAPGEVLPASLEVDLRGMGAHAVRQATTLHAGEGHVAHGVEGGGTAEGAVKLLRQIGANVLAACFIIDLPDLGGADKLRAMDVPVRTLMTFEGH